MTPQQLEQQYGVSRAYADTIVTADGSMRATIVPAMLADGGKAELIIFHPVDLRDGVTRQDLIRSSSIVETRPDAPHRKRRSWEKDALMGLIYDLAARHP